MHMAGLFAPSSRVPNPVDFWQRDKIRSERSSYVSKLRARIIPQWQLRPHVRETDRLSRSYRINFIFLHAQWIFIGNDWTKIICFTRHLIRWITLHLIYTEPHFIRTSCALLGRVMVRGFDTCDGMFEYQCTQSTSTTKPLNIFSLMVEKVNLMREKSKCTDRKNVRNLVFKRRNVSAHFLSFVTDHRLPYFCDITLEIVPDYMG